MASADLIIANLRTGRIQEVAKEKATSKKKVALSFRVV